MVSIKRIVFSIRICLFYYGHEKASLSILFSYVKLHNCNEQYEKMKWSRNGLEWKKIQSTRNIYKHWEWIFIPLAHFTLGLSICNIYKNHPKWMRKKTCSKEDQKLFKQKTINTSYICAECKQWTLINSIEKNSWAMCICWLAFRTVEWAVSIIKNILACEHKHKQWTHWGTLSWMNHCHINCIVL